LKENPICTVSARNSEVSRLASKIAFQCSDDSGSRIIRSSKGASMRATPSSSTSAIQRSALSRSFTMPASTAASSPPE